MILDANVGLGRCSAGLGTDTDSPEKLLEYLDCLGIDRALVYSVLSREADPAAGNELLMRQIGGSERLLPSWVLVPGEMAVTATVKDMQEAGVRVGRVFTRTGGFSPRPYCLGPLGKGMEAAGGMVLFIDQESTGWTHDATDWDGIYQLCKLVPNLPIVVVGATASDPRRYHWILEQCPNMHLEMSQLICPNQITQLSARGLADRLVFGSGTPLIFAGGILSMIHCEDRVNEPTRNAILGGNLARLMGIDLSRSGADGKCAYKPAEVIDMHAHYGRWHKNACGGGDADSIISQMDRCGVKAATITSLWACHGEVKLGNDAVAKACAAHPGRLYGYITIDPKHAEEVRCQLELHGANPAFRGLKFHCEVHDISLIDPLYEPAISYANERSWVILIHGGPSGSVAQKLCRKYPNAKFLRAHVGGKGHRDTDADDLAKLSRDLDNLYLGLASSRMTPGTLERLVELGRAERVVYGSDHPLFDLGYEIGRITYSGLSTEQKGVVLSGNARVLLGLSDDQGA